MTKYVMVIPYADKKYFDACLKTLKIPHENILAVDNTKDNTGVAGSWNLGIKLMKQRKADWLIICSAAMRFGRPGGLDMISQLEENPTAQIVNFADLKTKPSQFVRGKSVGVEDGMFSWHCCAVSKQVISDVGKFDANFYPIYFEDIDYDVRVNHYYGSHRDWPIVPIDACSAGIGHGVKSGNIKVDVDKLIAYFATKWGRHPSAAELGEYFKPFNDVNNLLAFWPPANGEAWDE